VETKIFGGFTDTDWGVTNNYKNTDGAFLFSITDREKYNLKSPQHAMYTNSGYIAAFGGGFDFYLAANCNTTNSSYSNFGHSYDSKSKPKESLAGAYNFTTKEIEVYQIEISGSLLLGNKKKKLK